MEEGITMAVIYDPNVPKKSTPLMREDPLPQPEDGKEKKEKKNRTGKDGGNEKNAGEGHRQRLRERFLLNGGFDSFKDYEVLELLLTYASPRKDTKGVAKELLEEFGTLRGVLEARPEQLLKVKGVGEAQATMLMMAVELTRVWAREAAANQKKITNRGELESFCKGLLMGERSEQFYVICVDAQCQLKGKRKISEGSLSEVSAYPRTVMETALNYNAHSVFFCHNHPGGTCSPSSEDIASTLQLQRMLNSVGVLVLDHLIIAGDKAYSMAQHGDVDFRNRRINE